MAKTRLLKQIKNERGMVSADFIFSLVIAAGVSAVLFAVTFTLSMVEIAQYMAFSSARAMAGADLGIDNQVAAAQKKYEGLLASKTLQPLFSAGGDTWFIVSKELEVRPGGPSGTDFREEYGQQDKAHDPRRSIYTGVRFDFKPKLMSLRIAMLGSTSLEGDGSEFATKINAIMLREPSFRECFDLQVKQRYDAIGRMPATGSGQRYGSYVGRGKSSYVPMEDNGC
ncbi:MAG: hypothetical protein ACLGGX_00405 [Bdellovibrionia bacterium]